MSIFNTQKVSFEINGQEVTIETGKMARQADGSVVVRQGNCAILATAVANKEPKEGQSFFPLSVDYQEKFASSGKIPGSFFKRETKLSDYEVLISRLVDRAIRPLFPEDYFCDVQILIYLISHDDNIMPDALACLAASAALAVSDIPIQEIISEVRIGRINGEMIVNPTRQQLPNCDMDFIIAATEKNIMMVEGEAKECQEEDLVQAIELAHEHIRKQIEVQKQLRNAVGITTKREYAKPYRNEELEKKIIELSKDKLHAIASSASSKHARSEAFSNLYDEVKASLGQLSEEDEPLVGHYYGELQYHVVRDMILNERKRLDGRGTTDVRPIEVEVDLLPGPHGVSLFTRGETQSLTSVTLGTSLDTLLTENAAESTDSKFYLHYNFPPFSTGEIKPMRAPGRREVGHGNLAMRSLKQMMPGNEYPYTVRVVSDILESNGSSSMATVCAGSLALMDAGVPIPKHVSGVAMGLITKGEKYAILTDILGDEDHLGDMDFKVTGTKDGICGVQMDIKVDGLSMDIMREALAQAKQGRLHILDIMYKCISEHRPDVKSHTPRMEKLFIDKEFIGAVIGPGGKVIQEMQKETNTTITIEEVGDKGEVSIFSKNKEGLNEALRRIQGIVAVPEVGAEYEGKVTSIREFGAFVEFLPKKEGLLHISEISWKRLDSLEGVINEGDVLKVKLIGVDPKTGKFRLSRKVLMPKPEGHVEKPERGERNDKGDKQNRGGFKNDRGDRKSKDFKNHNPQNTQTESSQPNDTLNNGNMNNEKEF